MREHGTSASEGTGQGGVLTRLVNRYGPGLVDFRLPVAEMRIWLDAPKVHVARLRLVTSLALTEGYQLGALQAIVNGLEGEIRCGQSEDRPLSAEISATPIGPVIEFDVGPSGMYTSELVIRTNDQDSLQALLDRSFVRYAWDSRLPDDYVAALLTVASHGGHGE